ncbi:MAG TPA: serine/threonine-protein kinase [Thermoanaerobaculia bacterium]
MTSTTPLTHQEFGPYEIIHLLGKGAMGSVYLARDRRIGRRVALKVVQPPSNAFEDTTSAHEFYRRLQREAEVYGALLHPNIVTLYDVGYENDRVTWMAMEYVEGETLLELERRSGPVLAVEVVIGIAADVLRGLEGAHAKGIIHRDIKPANILIAADGTAKIADFGIARPLESSMTRAGSLMGTPNYMSPEQASGKDLTTNADIFSLGVVLYESLTGTKPFMAADLPTTMNNIINQPVPALPGPIGDVISRMMAKSPEERPDASQALVQLHTPPTPAVRIGPATWLTAAVAIAAIVASFFISSGSATSDIRAIRELNEKRRALAEAQRLFDQGKYAESLHRYETYLQKYPMSTVAQDGRNRAREALAPPKPRRRPRRDQDISARELLQRFKRAIRGK